MNMQGKGPVTVSYGNRIRISNGTITGADDGINLKATVRETSDIVIENIIGINCANVFSIGTEVKFPVKNVTVNNIVGTNCVTLVWIKPGNVNYNSTNSLVENIVITGGSIQDTGGARYQRAIYITGAYTNRMKNITIANITANVRCFTTGTTRAFVHVFPDNGSSIESLNIYNSNFRDANDGLVAGTANQVMWGILLEPSAGGSISNAIFSGIEIYGTGGNGYLETPGSITNVILRDMVFRKNNNGTGSFAVEALAANIEMDDIRVLDSPFANPISTAAHTGTNFYMLHAGSNARMWSGFDATRTLTPQVIGTDPILTFSNAFFYTPTT